MLTDLIFTVSFVEFKYLNSTNCLKIKNLKHVSCIENYQSTCDVINKDYSLHIQ